uniref:Glycoside hydrolase family 5 domain protein n=1 Tax=Solanum tuberosum TaxID=4113 RepID=M1DV39_SOLTU
MFFFPTPTTPHSFSPPPMPLSTSPIKVGHEPPENNDIRWSPTSSTPPSPHNFSSFPRRCLSPCPVIPSSRQNLASVQFDLKISLKKTQKKTQKRILKRTQNKILKRTQKKILKRTQRRTLRKILKRTQKKILKRTQKRTLRKILKRTQKKEEEVWEDHMEVSEMGSNVYDPRNGGVINISSEHSLEESPEYHPGPYYECGR